MLMTMASSPSTQRRRPGEVRDAILTTLSGAGRPMKVDEIRAAVTAQLGSDVPASSVRSYLNINCGPGKQFERLGRGEYKLSR